MRFFKKSFLVFILLILTILAQAEAIDNHMMELYSLNAELVKRGVTKDWLFNNIERSEFKLHSDIGSRFHNLPEHRVIRKEKDTDWYKKRFAVDYKVKKGKEFIKENIDTLKKLEQKNGIHYELVAAIIGMETNFAQNRFRGNFNAFDVLVSQYIFMPRRRNFAINQLAALYKFSNKIKRPVDYFMGSFAGACGWGQFIPASMISFFVSAEGDDSQIDIFSVEDNLYSIENYLFLHRLKADNIKDEKSLRSAVFAYNRSDAYVDAVLYIYRELKSHRPYFLSYAAYE